MGKTVGAEEITGGEKIMREGVHCAKVGGESFASAGRIEAEGYRPQ